MSEPQVTCKEPGLLVPWIELGRCEAKADCVRVCPYGVFEIRVLSEDEKQALSWPARMKSLFHGHRKAFVERPDDCHGCGLCVTACPERAITLRKAGA